jgi:hypothetical protein
VVELSNHCETNALYQLFTHNPFVIGFFLSIEAGRVVSHSHVTKLAMSISIFPSFNVILFPEKTIFATKSG